MRPRNIAPRVGPGTYRNRGGRGSGTPPHSCKVAGTSRLKSFKTPPFMPSSHRAQPKSREARLLAVLPS
jgi:hypothetical protein